MTHTHKTKRRELLRQGLLLAGAGAIAHRIPTVARADDTQADTLRVLSYNIHMWQPSVDDVTKVVKSADADIVGLNEAWSEERNEQIAKRLGYNIVYGGQNPTQKPEPKPHTVNGFYMPQVLLTKHTIVKTRHFNAMANKEHASFDPAVPIFRGGTLAELETAKGNRLVVFVLHLHPWGDGDNERMTNMRLAEINGILGKLKAHDDKPTLIIGDFNTQSHHDVQGGWKVTRQLEDNGFKDLYRTAHPDAQKMPGLTCGDDRIDFIFYNKHVTPGTSRVLTDSVFESRGYKHSDHLGVFGTVTIGG